MKNLLGKRIDQVGRHFKEAFFAAILVPDVARNSTVAISNPNHEEAFTVEELCGYILTYVKKTAEDAAGESIRDCVITIPPYFDTFARNALIDAAYLAGLNVLELMHDITAAAYRYSLSVKSEEKPQYYVFGNLGHTTSSVARLSIGNRQSTNSYGANVTVPHLDILDYKSVPDFGGLDVDLAIREYVLKGFFEKHSDISKESLRSNIKVMNRILREVNKAKHALSLSSEYTMFFDSLIDGRDYSVALSRDDLASLCSSQKERLKLLFQSVTTPEVTSVVLVGGHSRIAFVHDLFKEGQVPATEQFPPLALNINADEAVALGACLRAAVLSRKFVVMQDIRIKEYWPFDVQLSITQDDPLLEPSLVTLLTNKASLDSKKIITLKKKKDFDISIYVKDTSEKVRFETGENGIIGTEGPLLISKVFIKNVESVIQGIEGQTLEDDPQVKVTLKLTNSGLIAVENAILTYNYFKNITVVPPPKNLNISTNATDASTNSTDGVVPEGESVGAATNSTLPVEGEPIEAASTNSTTSTTEPVFELVKKARTIDLLFEQVFEHAKLSLPQIGVAKKRAEQFENYRLEKYLLESTQNELESAAYQFRYRLEDDEWTPYIAKETQDAIHKDIRRVLEALEENDSVVTLDWMKREIDIFKGWQRPIEARRTNAAERPQAVLTLEATLKEASGILDTFEPKPATTSQVLKQAEDLQKLLESIQDWLKLRQQQQSTLPTWETPILWANDILKKSDELKQAAINFQRATASKPTKTTTSATKETPPIKGSVPTSKFDFDFDPTKMDGSSPEKLREMLEKLQQQMETSPKDNEETAQPTNEPSGEPITTDPEAKAQPEHQEL